MHNNLSIDFNPEIFNPLFWKLKNADTRFVINYGGAGSGKSYAQAQNEVLRSLESTQKILVLRKVGETLRDSVIPLVVDEIISKWGISHVFNYNKTDRVLTNKINSSQIIFRGFDDPEKIKSIQGITRIWIEEASEFTEEDVKQLDLRLRGADDLQMTLTFNPIDENHWIKKYFFDSKISGCSIFQTNYKDNKFIDARFRERLESYRHTDPYFYDVYALGAWGVMKVTTPFFRAYDPQRHEDSSIIHRPEKELIISIDFNLDPFAVNFYNLWSDAEGLHLHQFDEADIRNGSVQTMAELITERYGAYLPNCRITGDAMGKRREISQRDHASNYQLLFKELGLRPEFYLAVSSNPTHENSRTDCNLVLARFPDFKINPLRCPNTIRDMKIVQCDAYGSILKSNRKEIAQQADHADATRYCFHNILGGWLKGEKRG